MSRPRVPPVLVALLAASVTAGAGAWKRWRAPPALDTTPAAAFAGVAARPTASVSAVFAPTAPAPTEPGRAFRGDRARRHRSAFVGPRAAPSVRFTFDAGGPIEAMPAITSDGDVVVASLSGKVTRLGAAGAVVWTADLGERVYASPLIVGESVFLGSDARRFVALSLATGKTRWQLDADGEADTALAEAPGGALVGAAGRVLHGLRADGSVRFRLKLARKIYASPAIGDDGTIYVGAQDKKLHAIAGDGAHRWSRDLGGDVDCAPAIGDDGTIYVGSDVRRAWQRALAGDGGRLRARRAHGRSRRRGLRRHLRARATRGGARRRDGRRAVELPRAGHGRARVRDPRRATRGRRGQALLRCAR